MKFNFFIIFSFLSFFVLKGNIHDKPKYTEKKTYHWNFNVHETALFEIQNKYGDVNITTWDQNTIEINAVITYGHLSEKIAKEKIKCVDIITSGTNGYVSAITKFNCDLSTKNKQKKGNYDKGIKINYEVKIPSYANLIAKNKYGNIILGTIGGNTNIELKYGALIAQTLKSNSNIFDLDYSTGTSIQLVNNLTIKDANYSDITINQAKTIRFNSDYTDIKVDKVEQVLSSTMDYGKLDINEINCITFTSNYTNVIIDTLHSCLHLDINYGSYKINQTDEQFNSIKIDASYTIGKINVHEEASFNLLSQTKYTKATISPKFRVTHQDKNNTSETIKAKFNPSGCICGIIDIKNKYGTLQIETNK